MRSLVRSFAFLLVALALPRLAEADLPCGIGSSTALLSGLSSTTITQVNIVALPPSTGVACRIRATIRPLGPSGDSVIDIELYLPVPPQVGGTRTWNGRFLGVGNGGFNGSIPTSALNQGARFGFATAGTDTGHRSFTSIPFDASWAFGHPEKVTDFAYRAVHEMTEKSKTMTANFYGATPLYSYWDGASSGGKQALKEAQLYPFDYDGILAGAPVNFWTRAHAHQLYVAQVSFPAPDGTASSGYIPLGKRQMMSDVVLAACDADDGVVDGVLDDPRACHFSPASLQCPDDIDGPACLTSAQVHTAEQLYADAKFSNGEVFHPGFTPSSEFVWGGFIGGPEPAAGGVQHFTYLVHAPGWDWHTFSPDVDLALAEVLPSAQINAIDPNLFAFKAGGGKLIHYHGWLDLGSAVNSINYYQSVVSAMGSAADTQDFYRLFLMPGVQHVGGGPGPGINLGTTLAQGDARMQTRLNAIMQWVENGIAPDRIIATHYEDTSETPDRTRPLCPYPQTAHYTGSGSTDEAANFLCKTAPTITWANPAPIIYGTALSAAQLNATADVSGTFTYTPAGGTYLGVGAAQTLSVSLTPDDTTRYVNAAASVVIDVIYAQAGTCLGQPGHAVLQPINVDGSSVFKRNSTVPVKFRVCDATGQSIGTGGVVQSFTLVQIAGGTATQTVNEPVDSTTPDDSFRWDATGRQWIFNLSTKALMADRTYTYRIVLNDGSHIEFSFGLK